MEIIKRDKYSNQLKRLMGKGLIVVLTGQRRVGKSYVLRQLVADKQAEAQNVIYIDKEQYEFDKITTYQKLNDYIQSKLHNDCHNYILIDEVQDIQNFEMSLRNFYNKENVDIVVTGSNAKMLSSELSTLLSGRYMEIHVSGLSYNEFLKFQSLDDNDTSLMQYLRFGGLPHLHVIGIDDTELVKDYLLSVYTTILFKDIVAREQIRNVAFLENLVRFLADNTGKIISASSISKYMKSQEETVTTNMILSYINYLCNAFIINKVLRYDIHGKRLFESNEKYYFSDTGLRNALGGGLNLGNIEKVIENAVYLHLNRLGFLVRIGQFRKMEIDFVATRSDRMIYIQVSYLISTQETMDREFGNLQLINDNYPKYVISMDPLPPVSDYNGITHLTLRKFLSIEDF